MIKLKPVITEKSLLEAKKGNYTFAVDKSLRKEEIKKLVEHTFDVKVKRVRTIVYKDEVKRNYLGRKIKKSGFKKVIVSLSGKDKIDIFEQEK
jgi:large subunit ribosomal protein L23